MPMYALATVPLIKKLPGNYKQVWYADDAAAVGKIVDLRDCWDKISTSAWDLVTFQMLPIPG